MIGDVFDGDLGREGTGEVERGYGVAVSMKQAVDRLVMFLVAIDSCRRRKATGLCPGVQRQRSKHSPVTWVGADHFQNAATSLTAGSETFLALLEVIECWNRVTSSMSLLVEFWKYLSNSDFSNQRIPSLSCWASAVHELPRS